MIPTPSIPMTLNEFLALPETKPAAEYIRGQIIQKPMPQGKHSIIQAELVSEINRNLKRSQVACAFPELRCTFGGRSIVPDIGVLSLDRIPRDQNGEVAHIFALSPD